MGTLAERPTVAVRLLGPFEVDVDDRPVHIGSPKQRAVLAFLALHAGRLVTGDALREILWGERPPSSSSVTLQSLISRLRAALSSSAAGQPGARRDLLRTREPGWVLDVDPAAVDALRFLELTARAPQRAGRGDIPAAAADLVEALALWRGEPFVDVVAAGYLTAQATALAESRLGAVEDLADAELALGRAPEALARLEHHVGANPFRERAWAQLMVALYRLDRQAAALQAFQQVRSMLRDELGLEPSAILVETEQRILRHDPSLAPDPPAPTAPAAASTGEFADYSVLVVEDHDFQRRTVVQLLRRLGVGTVDDAANGIEALALLRDHPAPDIVLCDIDMPGMDGVEFVTKVAEEGLADAVVIASGLEANVLRAVKTIGESHGLDVLAALEKPLTARALGDALRRFTPLAARPGRRNDETVDAQELRQALAGGDITTLFEARIDLSTGAVRSLEAAGCWTRPDGSVVPAPALLAAVAREGLGLAFVERVVDGSCALVAESERAGLDEHTPMRVATNVAFLPFADASLADRLHDMARAHGVDPQRFVWELDEVVLARASSTALEGLTRLRVKGFGLSVIHAGLTASWPDLLTRAPLSEVKLGHRLVKEAAADGKRAAVVESAVAAARQADLPVVAAGCDTASDFDMLVALGCTEAQGQYVAEPTSADQLVAWAVTGQRPGTIV